MASAPGQSIMITPTPAEMLRYFRRQRSQILDTIQQLVEIESPSDVKAAVDRLGAVLASRFSELGGRVKLHLTEKFGNHLQVEFGGKARRKPIVVLGHTDTVYPIGTISMMPYRIGKGRVWGPGVLDMKGGIALALHVIEALLKWNGGNLPSPVTALLVSDEEVGSTSSRQITEKLARSASAVLVLEPGAGLGGAVKTGRKGIAEYSLQVQGVAAHAGLDFEHGHSAIVELARQILRLSELVDVTRGTTLNVGRITGGTRSNVVAAEARAVIDLRARTSKDAEKLDRDLKTLRPFDAACRITVSGGMNRPPMERNAGVAALYEKARQVASQLDWDLGEASVGGGSDGNFTAALGIPTLDGLGAVGEGAHARHESVRISELPRRAALLAGLITSL
jgi:glutamate carboxypeptidase